MLWEKPRKETKVGEYLKRAEEFLTQFGWKKKEFKLLNDLERDNWKKVYQDDISVIYRKHN